MRDEEFKRKGRIKVGDQVRTLGEDSVGIGTGKIEE